ncbi:MAG: hypothetical protein AAFV95_17460 [Bacteroidota bacterium]
MKEKEIAYTEALEYASCISALVVTATPVEMDELLDNLEPLPDQGAILRTYKDSQTYYLGIFGAYLVVAAESNMGAARVGGAIMTVSNAINDWSPKAVLMVGIAFGVDKDKQQIGDVLVSGEILPYTMQRRGKEVTIQSSPQPEASITLRDRFRSARRNWSHSLPDGEQADMKICQLLSGDVLVDNIEFRNELLSVFPKAKGGEMEGNGVYVASTHGKLDWIVVKAICDFADGEKSVNKKENQQIAIRSSVSLCKHVFSSRFAFQDLGFVLADECIKSGQSIVVLRLLSDEEVAELRRLITNNRLDRAFAKLEKLLENTDRKHPVRNELATLSADWANIQKRDRLNLADYGEVRKVTNQIVYSLLELIDRLR